MIRKTRKSSTNTFPRACFFGLVVLVFIAATISSLCVPIPAQAADDFTIVVLPDTQYYSWTYPDIFLNQTQWIAGNRGLKNIAHVAHVGDLVQNAGEQTEWENADLAMSVLEDPFATNLPEGIPYGVLPGDHDQPAILYNQFFGIDRFMGRSYYGGSYSSTKNDNNFTLFSAGGMDFIVVNIAKGAGGDVLNWANALLKKWSVRRAIVVTHILLHAGDPADFTSSGLVIFNALKNNPNLFLMLGGHNGTEGMRTDVIGGNTIYSLLSNYQILPNGGNGWLRYMTFSPSFNEITFTTYSTLLDLYGDDPVMGTTTTSQEFALFYDMSDRPSAPPSAPTGLNALANSFSQIDVSWTDTSTNEAGFEIEWSFNGGSTFDLLAVIAPKTSTYSHANLMEGTEYCYRVRAINAAGASAYTSVDCETTMTGPTIVTYRQGVDAYFDNVDTNILGSESGQAHGNDLLAGWDSDFPGTTGQPKFGLVRFDNIFGQVSGQIPAGATIQSATLRYVVADVGDDANVNEVTVDWEETVTFNDFGTTAGVQTGDYGTFVDTATGSATGAYVIDVTTSLAAWVDNPSANRGWIFRPTGTNGVDFKTSESSAIGDRPLLTVAYFPPPTGVPTAPSAPIDLSAIPVSFSQIDLTWTDTADNEAGFKIEWSDDGGTSFALLATTPVNSQSYSHAGLMPDSEYCYRVRAINAAGESANTVVQCATTGRDTNLPTAPTNIKTDAISYSEVDISWIDTADNESGFQIEWSIDGGLTFAPLVTVSANTKNYIHLGLSPETEYCYRVRAINVDGESAYTAVQCATTWANNVTISPGSSATQNGGGGGGGGGCFIQTSLN